MKQLTIYCAHPISGQTWEQVCDYYNNTKKKLTELGFNVLHPMTGKNNIRTEINQRFQAADFKSPVASNHAIFERDKWMVSQSDIVYLNLTGSTIASIGSMMEIAWAALLSKYTIVIMEKENLHRHAFVIEAADIIFETEEEAITYLEILAKGDI